MTQFKMHPLHTQQDHIDRMKSLGVAGYHQWLADKRFTGRSTAQALELLAKAINNPGRHIDIEDHANLERGLTGKRIISIDVGLQDLVRHMAVKLGLEHIHTHARGSGPTVVFERRPPTTSVPPVPAQEIHDSHPKPCLSAEVAMSSPNSAYMLIRQLMRHHGLLSATTLHGEDNGEGHDKIVFSPVK